MKEILTKLFIYLNKRAEKTDRHALIASFVDVGPLGAVLSTIDNQILCGRRGTGKTHALTYLSGIARDRGDIPSTLTCERLVQPVVSTQMGQSRLRSEQVGF